MKPQPPRTTRTDTIFPYETHFRSVGAGPCSDTPYDIFTLVTLPDKFPVLAQSGMIDSFYTFDFERLAGLIEENYQACIDPTTGSAQPGTCLATFNTDRRITEKTLAPYLQVATQFDLMGNTGDRKSTRLNSRH